MTAASGWDGAAISEAARRVRQPSAACSLAARGDDGVFMGAVLKRGGAAQAATHGWRGVAALQVGTGESAPVRRGQPGACAGVGSPDPLVSGILPLLPLPLLAQS